MPEKKPVVGLSWQPQLPIPSLSKAGDDPSQLKLMFQIGPFGNPTQLVDGPYELNKLLRQQAKDTAGRNWNSVLVDYDLKFDMPAQTITPELQKELKLLKLRDAIDPKRHYNKGGSKSKELPKYFQMGTVVESPMEFFSGRLTKKERKETLADELLSDQKFATYRKRKVREIEEKNRPAGNEKWKIKGQISQKCAKERRIH